MNMDLFGFSKDNMYLCSKKKILYIMKLKFSTNYNTSWGISLHVYLLYYSNEGDVVSSSDIPMLTDDGISWTVETTVVESRQKHISFISYQYIVCDDSGKALRKEWNMIPRKYYVDVTKDYEFPDIWRDMPLQYHLYSKAYITTVNGDAEENLEPMRLPSYRKTVVFRVSAPQLKRGEILAVLGSHPILGSWNVARFMPMTYCGKYEWMLAVNVDNVQMPLEYKYIIVDKENNNLKEWEGGDNRTTGDAFIPDGKVLVLYGESVRVCEPKWKIAGVVIPVFSLRSEHSYGVGDFGDLRRMVDWACIVGMHAIQILPINDTTMTHHWTDSYPYNTISIYALHPHYIDLETLGTLKDRNMMIAFNRQRQELNALDCSDYETVDRVKTSYLHVIYKEIGEKTFNSHEFSLFFNTNRHWLEPYAVFCYLRDKYHTAHFSDWQQLSVYTRLEIEAMCKPEAESYSELQFTYFVQFVLHCQLLEVTTYARSKGVIIKGDLPIGISRDSVEAWMEPQYFNLDSQTGAPPDAFSYNGQNWNFPTYNWDAMYQDGCRWWRQRFANMEQYFDAFRIDHILGFFRIWEIPCSAVHGLLGHFSPSLPLNISEIEYYGLTFHKDLYTRPFINDNVLIKYFGIHASYVSEHFLKKKSYDMYNLLPEYDTQVKVKDEFNGKNDENSLWIRDGLYRLLSNVLFVEDTKRSGMYHPRIAVYQEPVYNALSPDNKDAFMHLYNHYFYERHNSFWRDEALRKLPLILNDTSMLVCGEDLGMLPECVGGTLDALRILTLEIQSMPKKCGYEFAHLDENPYRSVATISTHDMSTLRMWWEENPERTQHYFTTMLQKIDKAPKHLPAWMAEEIIARHLYSPSMLCMLSFQDWTALDGELREKDVFKERINVPSDPFNRWCYRMHITIEELMKSDKFNGKLKQMIKLSQR